jgi:Tol biopolymer transport system component
VKVTAGEKATAEFTVTCAMVPIPRGTNPIAFTGNAPDLLAVFLVNADGSALTNLAEGRRPVWSPDGQKILFLKKRELWVMNADGSGQQLLSERGPAEYVWSPDGKKIGFTIEGDELWVMQSDGSAQMFLATNASNPAWSPDGNKLVFSDLADLNLRIINSDGTGNTRLTEQLAFDPAWSPDGTRITFATLDERDIWLINPDGTGRVNLTPGSSEDDGPVWSPDGSKIAFNTGPQGQPLESEVAVMSRDGTGRVVLTNHPGFDFSPAWSPDGSKIAFQRFEITGDLEIYVMNADGSGQTNVSNRSDIHDTEADW